MGRARVETRLFTGCAAAALLLLALAGLLRSEEPGARKANLDLPYNAGGEREDREEDFLDVIVFYGGAYEARSVVLCLDYSESMKQRGELELQTVEALRAVSELDSRTRFGLVFYGGNAEVFRRRLVPANDANKAAAKKIIASKPVTYGTCMRDALLAAFKLLQGEERGAVIVGGDGKPTLCPPVDGYSDAKQGLRSQIVSSTLALNAQRKTVLHSIYVGNPNPGEPLEFMRRLSQVHGGSFRVVPTTGR